MVVMVELVEPPSTFGCQDRGPRHPKVIGVPELVRAREVNCVIAVKTD